MGIHKSKLNKVAMNKLVEETNFTKQEIRHWHDGFLQDCPTGKLTKYEFAKIYQSFFPKGDPTAFAAFVFNVFDENKDGSIEFSEFITALSLTSRGHFEEKLEWAFRLYDIDNNGTISRDEMLQIVSAIFRMVGNFSQEETPEQKVDRIFSKMDTDGNCELSKEEFFEGARMDKSIVQALSLYNGLV
ncbi:unnamed protein product [Oikopleura dioica]|uniref:Neuronal calcium sensor 1 n=1 Tax=Oikopleura dioica TaxID=34765 RepID=E4XF64_OIKDI|nr:unnamed protein product [Oikopleura dioica]